MRIISRFKDYYDSVQRHGMDKSIVYIRESKEIRLDSGIIADQRLQSLIDVYSSLPSYLGIFNYSINSALIGFCGEWYTCMEIRRSPMFSPGRSISVYSYAELLDFAQKENNEKLTMELSSNRPYNWRDNLTYATVADATKNLKSDLFMEFRCPIITVHRVPNTPFSAITFNGALRGFDFMKVKDPFQAYQDLSMYVGGVLSAPEKETIEIGDDYMRDKKGFDRWSFRKKAAK